jgi:hypothetical protein
VNSDLNKLRGSTDGSTEERHLSCVPLRWQDLYIPSFMKIDTGVEGILGCCLRSLKGCNVGITGINDL